MITPALPSNLANGISPFSPVGKVAVGEENIEARNTPFKPVTELADSQRLESRTSLSERAVLAEERTEVTERSATQEAARQRREQDVEAAEERQQQESEQLLIRELASRDREVRTHERAHTAVGGSLTGAPVYQFQRGPDGTSYAVGGEVPISVGQVAGDPEATLQNARRVQRAALAPAEPSPQDHRVAAQAAQLERQALQEIAERAAEEREMLAAEFAAEREEKARLREEQRAEFEQQELQAALAEQDRSAENSIARNNIDLNRRLLDIGAIEPSAPSGGLLNLLA